MQDRVLHAGKVAMTSKVCRFCLRSIVAELQGEGDKQRHGRASMTICGATAKSALSFESTKDPNGNA